MSRMSALYYSPAGSGTGVRFKKRKSRFTFEELQLLLSEVKKNRHIVVGKFNRGVSPDVKKRTWAAITARVNEISECPREDTEIIKKWSDLKCDTKRKVAAMLANSSRISRDLSPVERLVHSVLSPRDGLEQNGDGEDEDDVAVLGMPPVEEVTRPCRTPSHAHQESPYPSARESLSSVASVACYDLHYEIPASEDQVTELDMSEEEQEGLQMSSFPAVEEELQDIRRPTVASTPPKLETPPRTNVREQLAHQASLSVLEQRTANMLMETVSRSMERLSQSLQQLVETQQEFVRNSLRMQKETLDVLKDFSTGALAVLREKLNGPCSQEEPS